MALLQMRAPVDYHAQLGEKQHKNGRVFLSAANCGAEGFEQFLTDFKTSPEQTITHALGNINIDEDDLSDEYDFMDEDDNAQQQRQRERARKRAPQHKYKDMLQDLANRKINELVIDLDDLHSVRFVLSCGYGCWR